MGNKIEVLKNNKLWRDANKEFFYTVDKEDYEWLIKQAENVEELKEELLWALRQIGKGMLMAGVMDHVQKRIKEIQTQ